MASDWNTLMDKLAATGLTDREGRVVAAIARKTLGYRKPQGDQLSASQIAKLTGIGRTHVTETLALLEAAGVILRTGGGVGRAATVRLNLQGDWKRVPSSGHPNLSRPRDTPASQPVPVRGSKPVPAPGHTRGKGVDQRAKDAAKEIVTLSFDAYTGAGGMIRTEAERSALARHSASLAKGGTDHKLILAAARKLGREREFPGHLKRYVAELTEKGGLCRWDGLDRKRLTATQLEQCDCARCGEWLAAKVAA